MPRILPPALGLMVAPVGGQSDGRYYSDLVARRPRFHYRGRQLEVVRWFPRRGFVVTERYSRFELPLLCLRLARGAGRTTLRRQGFRPVTLYVRDGCYFRRAWAQHDSRGNPTLRPVVVWQRDGEFFLAATHDSSPLSH